MLSKQQARELIAQWIDPAMQCELTRFATGHDRNPGSEVNWADFLSELDTCRWYADRQGSDQESVEAHAQLDALYDYALAQSETQATYEWADWQMDGEDCINMQA